MDASRSEHFGNSERQRFQLFERAADSPAMTRIVSGRVVSVSASARSPDHAGRLTKCPTTTAVGCTGLALMEVTRLRFGLAAS